MGLNSDNGSYLSQGDLTLTMAVNSQCILQCSKVVEELASNYQC